MVDMVYETGVVKFFNSKSKFGFIRVDNSGLEIYVHAKDCLHELSADDKVKFIIKDAKRGPVAEEVSVIS